MEEVTLVIGLSSLPLERSAHVTIRNSVSVVGLEVRS
jgi:hypothetical protein